MKKVLSKLIFCLLFSTITLADINVAKEQCEDLGFKPGTEKYADCVMKLLLNTLEDLANFHSNNEMHLHG